MYYCIDFQVINNNTSSASCPIFTSFEMAQLLMAIFGNIPRQCSLQLYYAENASSCPITEAKQCRAQLILGWVIA